jgi:hypothetical protein
MDADLWLIALTLCWPLAAWWAWREGRSLAQQAQPDDELVQRALACGDIDENAMPTPPVDRWAS